MRMTRPKVTGADQFTIAEDQEEYLPITAARVWIQNDGNGPYPGVLVAFAFSDEERERIARGDDIYIALMTFGQPMQPIMVMCGKEEAAATFGLGVEET